MGDEHADELARLRAAMEQAREGGKELAANLWVFYAALKDEGFDEDQAMALTFTFLNGILAS